VAFGGRYGAGFALIGVIAAASVGGSAAWFYAQSAAPPFADADRPDLVARGAEIYQARCASCHGVHLEGQPNWQHLNASGRLPAPPHDQTGHSWMHSDAQLFHLVKHSVADVAPPGYVSDMPAYDGVIPDRDIIAVIAYIKHSWPTGVRVYQALQNPDNAGMPATGGKEAGDNEDWRLPADCGAEPARQ
jgi:mono/diheme cytochrome c family protein